MQTREGKKSMIVVGKGRVTKEEKSIIFMGGGRGGG